MECKKNNNNNVRGKQNSIQICMPITSIIRVTILMFTLVLNKSISAAPMSMPFNPTEIKANSIEVSLADQATTERHIHQTLSSQDNTNAKLQSDAEKLRANLQNFIANWNSLPTSFTEATSSARLPVVSNVDGDQQVKGENSETLKQNLSSNPNDQQKSIGQQQNVAEPSMIVSANHNGGDNVLKASSRMQSQRRISGPLRFG